MKYFLGVAFLAVSTSLGGCSSSSDAPEPEKAADEPVELKSSKDQKSDSTEVELISDAKRLYQAQMYTIAKQNFQTLRDSFPNGAYAQFAHLKAADCAYLGTEYPEAAALYEDFYKSNPGSVDAAYAMLQTGRSFLGVNKGVGRDKGPLEKALEVFDLLLKTYPQSPLIPQAKNERLRVIKRLSEQDTLIADFYAKQENQEAANQRRKVVAEKWQPLLRGATTEPIQPTPLLASAASVLPPAPKTVTVRNLAAPSKAAPPNVQLARVVPSAPARSTAGVQVSVPAPPPVTVAATRQGRAVVIPPSASPRMQLQRVTCRDADFPFVALEVNRLDPSLKDAVVEPQDGLVVLDVRGLASSGITLDCFDDKDLTITKDGRITLKTDQTLALTLLHDPARLLLMLQE